MKKRLLILALGLLGLSSLVSAQFSSSIVLDEGVRSSAVNAKSTFAEGDITWGYCNDDIDAAIGVGANAELSAAIHLTPEKFGVFKGSEIKAVNLGFAANVTNVSIFIRNTLTGANIYSQQVGSSNAGWKTVELTTPFTVPEEGFYIGYTCTGKGQIGFSGTGVTEGCYLWYNEWANYLDQGWGSLCLQVVIDGATYNTIDYAIEDINPSYAEIEKSFTVTGLARNYSKQKIESLSLEYDINGEAAIQKVAVCSIEPGKLGQFSFEADPISTNGEYTINVKITEPADEIETNNSKSGTVSVFKYTYDKKILVEEATGTWCQWCPYGFVGMALMNEKYPDNFIGIAVHNGDGMTVTAYDSALKKFITGYPSCVVNRKTVGHPYAELEDLYLAEMAIPSQVGISVEAYLNEELTKAEITTTARFGYTADNINCRLAYVIIENDVTGYKQTNGFAGGGAGAFYGWESQPSQVSVAFDEVARGIYSSFTGITNSVPTSVVEDEPFTHEYSITLPTKIQDKDQLELIVMLLDVKSGQVLNADKVHLEPGNAIGKVNATNDLLNIVSAENGVIRFNINAEGNSTIALYDVNGKQITSSTVNGKDEKTISATGLKGVYILKATTPQGAIAKKVIL